MNNHSEFMSHLFRSLNESKITYCVLKNYENLPEGSTRDIDIWVKKKDHGKFCNILLNTALSLDWELITFAFRLPHYKAGEYYFIKEHESKKPDICVIDASPFLLWRGISYMDENIISNHILLHPKGFYIPEPGIEAASLIFRGGMMGEIKERHQTKIIEFLNADPSTFIDVLEKPLGKNKARNILNLAVAGQWRELENEIKLSHKTIFRRAVTKKPFSQLRQWLVYYSGRIVTHLKPSHGFLLVLMGPDGAGKTTISKAILDSDFIKRLFIKRQYLYRRYFISWYKRLGYFAKGITKVEMEDLPQNKYSEPKKLGRFKSIIYIIYLGIDYLFGYYFVSRQKANTALILFDRYFYDYLTFKDFDNCPRRLLFFISKIIPRPDAVIYLKNDSEIIFSRKSERTKEEIERQIKIYGNIITRISNTFVVETKSDIDGVVNKIIRVIIDSLKKRNKGK